MGWIKTYDKKKGKEEVSNASRFSDTNISFKIKYRRTPVGCR